ncbi:rab-GTPase-TBC domain-containing protein [Crucibulum laeve]|uniref:Rab-GTPase-TBC domain-containing protein n=1 Tax=Crucibulum laeve TaxID=68775 RepID=A0A5C3LJY2_9AGAR|nr:rab-GTPase-TBC domain-containing protein [Crucibulum laeve]
MGMDATELARWTRFAAKGGIGKCTAICDCVAESPDDLMFLKDDKIIVLMQIPEQEGRYLGYCEGVVGSFQGEHVHFHSKLKRPVMTKRASVSTSAAGAKSPSPSNGVKSPSVSRPNSVSRRNSTRRDSDTHPRRSPSQNRSPYSHHQPSASIPHMSMEDDIPSSNSFSTNNSGSGAGSRRESGSASAPQPLRTSPHTTITRANSPLTRVYSPPATQVESPFEPMISSAQISTSQSTLPPSRNQTPPPMIALSPQPALSPEQQTPTHLPPFRQTSPPSSNTTPSPAPSVSPLLIQKRNPSSPPASASQQPTFAQLQDSFPAPPQTRPIPPAHLQLLQQLPPSQSQSQGENQPQGPSQPRLLRPLNRQSVVPQPFQHPPIQANLFFPPMSGASTSSALDTSSTWDGPSTRISLAMSDGEVGIGLSLLQDLANGMDSDSDGGSVYSDYNAGSRRTSNEYARDRDSGTVEGLMYGDDEEEGGEDTGRVTVGQQDDGDSNDEQEHTPQPPPTAGPSQPEVSHPSSLPTPTLSHSPIPFSQTQPQSDSPTPLSPASLSPTATSFGQQQNNQLRRPSLASNSSWEGASDIYDDYRYSRYSVMSKASSMYSRGSQGTMGGAAMSGSPPPIPDARPSIDGFNRPSFDSVRQRMNSGEKARPSIDSYRQPVVSSPSRKATIDSLAPPSVDASPGDEQPQHRSAQSFNTAQDPHTSSRAALDRHMSVDSEASVYTQASRLSTLSKDASDALGALPASKPTTVTSITSSSNHLLHVNRPQPLDLTQEKSPLLHTNWASPVSSPGGSSVMLSPASSSFLTPIPGMVPSMTASAGMAVLAGSGSGSAAPGGSATGIASVLRQQVEANHHPSPAPSVTKSETKARESVPEGDGLGGRIVIEDDKESPSKILDSSREIHDSPSSSPDPELMQSKLAPFTIANRTPSPGDDNTIEGGDATSDSHLEVNDSVLAVPQSPMVPSIPPPEASAPFAATTTVGGPPSHLRIRPDGGLQIPAERQRRSLFMPHPNAPKAPAPTGGPSLQADPVVQQQQQYQYRPRPNLFNVMRMAISAPRVPIPGPRPGMVRAPTIYGRTEIDLSVALNPVPIVFSVEPLPAGTVQARAPPSPHSQMTIPRDSVASGQSDTGVDDLTAGNSHGMGGSGDERPSAGPIPRANFFPKAPGLRPRSRSFSGFNSTNAEIPLPLQRSREEGSKPLEIPTAGEVKESLTALSVPNSPTTESPPSSSMSTSNKPVPKSSPLRPSPLSLPRNSSVGGGLRPMASNTALKSPTSPLAQTIIAPSLQVNPSISVPSSPAPSVLSNRPPHQLRQAVSNSNLNEPLPPRPIPVSRSTLPTTVVVETSSSSPSSSDASSYPRRAGSIQGPPRPFAREEVSSFPPPERKPLDTDAVSVHSTRSQLVSPPLIARQPSLRTKLSLPNLRRNRSKQDETSSMNSGTHVIDSETLQVQDMDFELVRPNLSRFEAARTSEDSGVLGRDGSLDIRPDFSSGLLRADSPSTSIMSGGVASAISEQRSPTTESSSSWGMKAVPSMSLPVSRIGTDSESTMDAHRNRELKWMATMSSVPPSQARKNKKVKKLLLDGVPSSVRYLVWSHLTDGKARVVPGVYTQLGARGRVPAANDIEKDIQRCFEDQPHLRSTQGPVLSLLQAYLTMVPDIQYTTGLTLIAGQLLLLAPEEDAFWIFVSVMDSHVRPYFSSSITQMEVDAALFSRALENNDSAVGKKVLVDMGINPSTICIPWFTSLFVGTLPPEYLNRVWDIFLYEGVPFLFRVAMALVTCCRRQILDTKSEETLLKMLHHPPPTWLPPTPEGFLSLVFSVKLKDDDVRKQRVKMEAQVKRQTQMPRSTGAGSISLPRS